MADRNQLLKEINEVSFTVNDLNLYLDTHPLEKDALDMLSENMKKRKQLLSTYGAEFEPLTMDCVCPDTNNKTESHTKYPGQRHFTWGDGPLPWEGGNV